MKSKVKETFFSTDEGWTWAWPEKQRHYYRDRKSLCGKSTIVGGLLRSKVGKDNSCVECYFMRQEEMANA